MTFRHGLQCSMGGKEHDVDKITHNLPKHVVSYLNNLDNYDLFDTLIGGNHAVIKESENILDSFLIVVANEILTIFNTVNVLFDGL